MPKIVQTITEISIHHEGESPLFSEAAIKVKLDDEGAGYFLVLEAPIQEGSGLKMDFEDVPHVVNAIMALTRQPGVMEMNGGGNNPLDKIKIDA